MLTSVQTEQKHCSDRLSLMFEHSSCSKVSFIKDFQLQMDLPPPSFTVMQVCHSCQSSRLQKNNKKYLKEKYMVLMHCSVFVCRSTCRPPVLSQVLPRAHSASQGSVVAVHRMQDLQQLSRSREECGEWMSECGRLAA